ncbi:DUF5955 family protein [Actinacidiphila acididurans]|uniref:DUF5955 family protein n=1 Tax=Actinacidiphila acididurans TaxID=2784346 RepID=UPI0027DCA661|nr:DUF5955 family protein [Actinacidiphila acididurans]
MGETRVLDDERSGAAARAAAQEGVAGGAGSALARAVARLSAELAEYRPTLPDRAVAEDELAALAGQARVAQLSPVLLDMDALRTSLLLLVAALGSVSALAKPLDAVRREVEDLTPTG